MAMASQGQNSRSGGPPPSGNPSQLPYPQGQSAHLARSSLPATGSSSGPTPNPSIPGGHGLPVDHSTPRNEKPIPTSSHAISDGEIVSSGDEGDRNEAGFTLVTRKNSKRPRDSSGSAGNTPKVLQLGGTPPSQAGALFPHPGHSTIPSGARNLYARNAPGAPRPSRSGQGGSGENPSNYNRGRRHQVHGIPARVKTHMPPGQGADPPRSAVDRQGENDPSQANRGAYSSMARRSVWKDGDIRLHLEDGSTMSLQVFKSIEPFLLDGQGAFVDRLDQEGKDIRPYCIHQTYLDPRGFGVIETPPGADPRLIRDEILLNILFPVALKAAIRHDDTVPTVRCFTPRIYLRYTPEAYLSKLMMLHPILKQQPFQLIGVEEKPKGNTLVIQTTDAVVSYINGKENRTLQHTYGFTVFDKRVERISSGGVCLPVIPAPPQKVPSAPIFYQDQSQGPKDRQDPHPNSGIPISAEPFQEGSLIPVLSPTGGSGRAEAPQQGVQPPAPVAPGIHNVFVPRQKGFLHSAFYPSGTVGTGASSGTPNQAVTSESVSLPVDPIALIDAALYPTEGHLGQSGKGGHVEGSQVKHRPANRAEAGIPNCTTPVIIVSNAHSRLPTGPKGAGKEDVDEEFEATYRAITGMLADFEDANRATNPLALTQTPPREGLDEDETMDSAESSTY